jgi:hypothetical protein
MKGYFMDEKRMRVAFDFKTKFYYIQCYNGTHWNDIISYEPAEDDYNYVDCKIVADIAKMISQGFVFDSLDVVTLNAD